MMASGSALRSKTDKEVINASTKVQITVKFAILTLYHIPKQSMTVWLIYNVQFLGRF